ncbi:MAG TPA: PIG-L family deacetylase [Euzebyales bacterium]|nr:PIG-L family deacetylase [Euzebyales bacterium]
MRRPQMQQWRDARETPPTTVLSVWAHPDDEAFLAAGALADAVDRGWRVVCVYATRGEQGWQGPPEWAPRDLGVTRSGELADALAAIGVQERWCLDYPDGGLTDVPFAVGVARMLTVLDEIEPDMVLTFGPDGFTGHPDHMAVSAWVTAAVRHRDVGTPVWHSAVTGEWVSRFGPALNEFDAFWPGHPIATPISDVAWSRSLDERLLDRKIAALRAHHSQTAHLFAAFGEPFLRAMMATEWFCDAEGVRALSSGGWCVARGARGA